MKCGFIAIIGRPSAGKSTLLNALCGEKVAITSPLPQTTRRAVRGIVNRKEGQLIFLDTPGYHASDRKFNLYLKDVVHRSLGDADLVLYVMDASRSPGPEEQGVLQLLEGARVPVVAAVNKIDLSPPGLDEIRGMIRVSLHPQAIINVSASQGEGLEDLVQNLLLHCPPGDPLYPEDFYTDQEPAFRIAEIIRGQAIARTEQEIPHALYVDIVHMEFKPPPANPAPDSPPVRKKLRVRAALMVERKSQVGIVVGKGGTKIKEIRLAALQELRRIFPWKIHLELQVKESPQWRQKDPLLKKMLGHQ